MPSNPFDVGGAFVSGFKGGQEVGGALGDRWNRYQINRQAKRAAQAEKKLYEAGVLTDGVIDEDAVGDDVELRTAIAERTKRNEKLRDVVMRNAGRGQDAEAQLDNALLRFDPYGDAPRGGRTSAVMLSPDGTPQTAPGDITSGFAPAEDPNRLERTVGQRKAAILGTSESAQLEKVGRQAVPQIFGKMVPHLSRVKSGKYTQDDIDNIGGGLQAMSMYVPDWRGANVGYDAQGKSFYIDKPGDADGNGIAVPLDQLASMTREKAEQMVFGGSQDLEAGYKLGLANEAAQVARGDKAAQASVELLKSLMPALSNDTAMASAISSGLGSATKAGFKYEAVEPEAALTRFGQSNVMAVSTPSGVTIYNAITPADKSGTGVPTNQWLDVQGQPLNRAQAEKMMGAAPGLVESIDALSRLKSSNLATAFQAINIATAAVSAGAPAQFEFQGEVPTTPAAEPTPTAVPGRAAPAPSTGGGDAIDAHLENVLRREGGLNMKDAVTGKPVNWGIDQKAHPEVDVTKLTREQAKKILREDYWDKFKIGDLPPAVQDVAFDAVVNHGGKGIQLAKQADGDPRKLIELRRTEYRRLAQANPGKYGSSLRGWMNRMDQLDRNLAGAPAPRGAMGTRERERLGYQTIKGAAPMADGGVTLSPELLDFLRV